MALRASSLQSTNTLAINREVGSQYDVILEVSKHLAEIDTLANEDISGLINSLNDAKDFTGIMVVTGETPSWDATNKVLTVPVEKGDAGESGRGITSIELISTAGLTKTYAINYTDGTSSTFTVINGANGINGTAGKSTYQLWLDAGNEGTLNDFLAAMRGPVGPIGPVGVGIQGEKGDAGQDLTIEQIVYNSDGTFTWHFSDETTYTTPNLKGPKGDKGDVGLTGLQGVSVHHIKGTSTTDLEGDFASYGEIDTYTLYGDAAETINLGYFRVNNGLAKEDQTGIMYKSTYDTDNSGVVDNAEKLNGLTAQEIQASITDLYGQPNRIATLDANGKVVLTQIPDSVLGQLEYMGTWDLTTFPTATQKGQYWIASVSGNGYVVGDWAVWNGTTFDKVDNTDAVATVAGRTGNVVLTKSDVGLANVDNTADNAKPVSVAQQTVLNLKANITSPALTGVPTAPTASVGTNTTQLATTAFVVAELNKIEEW